MLSKVDILTVSHIILHHLYIIYKYITYIYIYRATLNNDLSIHVYEHDATMHCFVAIHLYAQYTCPIKIDMSVLMRLLTSNSRWSQVRLKAVPINNVDRSVGGILSFEAQRVSVPMVDVLNDQKCVN